MSSSARTCTLRGCERKHYGRGYCRAHWMRRRRKGDAGTAELRVPVSGCSVAGCERRHYGRGWCKLHLERWRKTGDPLGLRPFNGFSGIGPEVGNWRGDAAGYDAIHKRLYVRRGKASEQMCPCGSEAAEWAYDGTDPNERVSAKGMRYSSDPDRYSALCVPCHRQMDLGVAS